MVPFAVGAGTGCMYLMRCKVPMGGIDVRGSYEQECGDDTCSWMAYERPMDDAHEKEKAHRQGV